MMQGSSASVVRSCLHRLAVLLGVTIATFAVAHAAGDSSMLPVSPDAQGFERMQMRSHLGLDQPLFVQYVLFLRHALQGDFGQSLFYRQAVAVLVARHLPATILLAGSAFTIALGLSIPLGIAVAARGGWAEWTLLSFSRLVLAIPPFWLGLVLVLIVSLRLRLLPDDGYGGLKHLALPAITLSLFSIARLSRTIEAAMREVLRADYIRTARAKGLSRHQVIWVHGFRNLLGPIVALAGVELCELASSSVVVEVVFAWPGIGRLAATALRQHDVPLLQGIVLMAGSCFVLINLMIEIICLRIDPRGGLA